MPTLSELRTALDNYLHHALAPVFSFDLNEIMKHTDDLERSKSKLITLLMKMDFSGIVFKTPFGTISLTKSAKEQGKWQITQFDKDNRPISDCGTQDKQDAIKVILIDYCMYLNTDDFIAQLQECVN